MKKIFYSPLAATCSIFNCVELVVGGVNDEEEAPRERGVTPALGLNPNIEGWFAVFEDVHEE